MITNGQTTRCTEITDLLEGVYIVTENTPDNGTSLIKIDGVNVTSNSKEITVEGGATGQAAVMISFTNNIGQTEITVKKIDASKAADAENRYLDQAMFSLQDANGHAVEGAVISDLQTGNTIIPDDKQNFNIPVTGVRISGLADGAYRLVERASPPGYIITNPVTTFIVSQGTVTSWSLNGTAGTAFEIPNPPGVALPQTGGPGTTLFMALGGLMTTAAGAVLALTTRRRRKWPAEG